jgi:alanine racemase
MIFSTHIEISKSALAHNLNFILNYLNPEVKFSAVVKGNAYGHGIEIIVPLQESMGVRHFSVFNAEEALRVWKVLKQKSTIMIMGMMTDAQQEWAIENDVEFFVFDFIRLNKAIKIASKIGKKALVHLEIETGMNRTGFPIRGLGNVIDFLLDNEQHLELKGVCSHFAGAESIGNYYRLKKQDKAFSRATKKIVGFKSKPLRHIACSAAVLRYPNTQLDLVRIGILQYGFFPNREVLINYLTKRKEHDDPLKRVITWKSRIMSIKEVKQGEFIGYGTSYFSNSPIKTATVPIGYSHGFSRSLSNQGRVIINGNYARVIGVVNMNMITIDVTGIPNVEQGNEVVIIGSQGGLEISVSSFSDYTNLVNYELLTRLPSEISRIIVD